MPPVETLTAAGVPACLDALGAARRRLRERDVADVLSALARVVDGWLSPDSAWRRVAETELPGATGFSPAMIRAGLPLLLEPLRSEAVGELLDRELGDRRVLDRVVGGRLARGPALIVHVLAGNLPALAAAPIALSLAVKSAAIVKAASGDRSFADLFARSIAEVDPELGACVAPRYWSGGDATLEELLFREAELVVMSGGTDSVAAARARCRARFIGHGHRVSLAAVGRETLRDPAAAAAALAWDASLWDQRGCLSPQVCFVEGDFRQACLFAESLVPELNRLAEQLPPAAPTTEEAAALLRFRDEAEWAAIAGAATRVLVPADSLDWTIVVEAEPVFRPTPLHRSLRVLAIGSLLDLPPVLEPARSVLETAGIAVAPERAPTVAEALLLAGVHRVCPVGRMQRPPLRWRQGGRPAVAEWVTWHHADELDGGVPR